MGLCNSSESIQVATAKVILGDGRLEEYTYPVRASYVLHKHPNTFICDSDEMDFDDAVSAVGGDELLKVGQLYFALPTSRLNHRLHPEEMAALAVKASSALVKAKLVSLPLTLFKDQHTTVPPPRRKGDKKFSVTLTAIKE